VKDNNIRIKHDGEAHNIEVESEDQQGCSTSTPEDHAMERMLKSCFGPHLEIWNPEKQRAFGAGALGVISVGQLRQYVQYLSSSVSSSSSQSRQATLLHFITRVDGESRRCVDVGALQAQKVNRHAVFQVASNFNGVEAISEASSPDAPRFTENYFMDPTQGPAASISAGAAALTRVHAAFHDPSKPQREWAQTQRKQVAHTVFMKFSLYCYIHDFLYSYY